MKKIFQVLLLLMFLTNILYSQNCDNYISPEEDKTTGDKMYAAKDFIIITKDGDTTLQLLSMLINDQKSLVLSLTTIKKIKCVDPSDEIHFLFDDKTKYDLSGNQEYNCEGAFSIYLGDLKKNDDLLKLLLTKKVASIRLYCRAGVLDVDLSKSDSDELSQEINCLNKLLKR
jgi:hypothetical protein